MSDTAMSCDATFLEYERLLLSIDSVHAHRAVTLFQFIAFGNEPILKLPKSNRQPLTIDQLAEVISFNFDASASLEELVAQCSGLLQYVEVQRDYRGKVWILEFKDDTVPQYLKSEQIKLGPARHFAVNESAAHELIAQTCLAYLLHIQSPVEQDYVTVLKHYPLADFATMWWSDFLPKKTEPTPSIQGLIRAFFMGPNRDAYNRWTRLVRPAGQHYENSPRSGMLCRLSGHCGKVWCCDAPPIIWASALGLLIVVKELLAQGVKVNEVGVAGLTALYMAVNGSHFGVAELLLAHGGDVADCYVEDNQRFCPGVGTSPLYNAAWFGRTKLLSLLLKSIANYGKPGWQLMRAMMLAAGGHQDSVGCVKALLHAGVDINALNEQGHCTLYEAAHSFKPEVVQLLLDHGANPNIIGGEFHNALQAAAHRSEIKTVELLLLAGALPCATGGAFGTALITAAWQGDAAIVKRLIEAGSDVKIEWNLGPLIHELNITNIEIVSGEVQYVPDEAFGACTSRELEEYAEASLLVDDNDQTQGSEYDLKLRFDKRAEQQEAYIAKNKYGCTHGIALDERYRLCGEIREAAVRISRRLLEAGVHEAPDGTYMMTAIQAAVARGSSEVIGLLVQHGVEIPAVIVLSPKEHVLQAEKVARRLRARDSFSWETKYEGRRGGAGSATLPPLLLSWPEESTST